MKLRTLGLITLSALSFTQLASTPDAAYATTYSDAANQDCPTCGQQPVPQQDLAPTAGALPQQVFAAVDQFPQSISACPDALKKTPPEDDLPQGVPNLCALYDRYHAALKTLQDKGINPPTRIAGVLAPRFIDLPDWNGALKKGNSDPNQVYQPAPRTWQSWEEAARITDQLGALDLENHTVVPITQDEVLTYHSAGLDGLARSGTFRANPMELGKSWYRETSTPQSQVRAMQNIEYPELNQNGNPIPGSAILKWHTTLCMDQQPQAKQDAERANPTAPENLADWPDLPNQNQAFVGSDGVVRQCGYILYSPPSQVPIQFQAWMNDINARIATWSPDRPAGTAVADPIATAARAQRWLVSIHPFDGGNGRTSRLVMDRLLESLGLPTPTLKEMNDDVGTPENAWAKEVGQGMLRTVQKLESCAKDPSPPDCRVVPAE